MANVLLSREDLEHGRILFWLAGEFCQAGDVDGLAANLLSSGYQFVMGERQGGVQRPQDIAHKVLHEWLRRNPTNCYGRKLCDVLQEIRMEDSALKLKRRLEEPEAKKACDDMVLSVEESFQQPTRMQCVPMGANLAPSGMIGIRSKHSPADEYEREVLTTHPQQEVTAQSDSKSLQQLSGQDSTGGAEGVQTQVVGQVVEDKSTSARGAVIYISEDYLNEFQRTSYTWVKGYLTKKCNIPENSIDLIDFFPQEQSEAGTEQATSNVISKRAPTVIAIYLAIDMETFERTKNSIKITIASTLKIDRSLIEIKATPANSVLAVVTLPVEGLLNLLQLALTPEGRQQLKEAVSITRIVPIGQPFAINLTSQPVFEKMSFSEGLQQMDRTTVRSRSQTSQESFASLIDSLAEECLSLTISWVGMQRRSYMEPQTPGMAIARDGSQSDESIPSSTTPEKRVAADGDPEALSPSPKRSSTPLHRDLLLEELLELGDEFDRSRSRDADNLYEESMCMALHSYSSASDLKQLLSDVELPISRSESTALWQAVCIVVLIRQVLTTKHKGFRKDERESLAKNGANLVCALLKSLAEMDQQVALPGLLHEKFGQKLADVSTDEEENIKRVLSSAAREGLLVWEHFVKLHFEGEAGTCAGVDDLWSILTNRHQTVGDLYNLFILSGQLKAARHLEVMW